MNALKISKELSIPLELATEATAILGKRGRGKTNTAVVIVEEMIGAGIPVCVVDTVGVWWGLKSSADGQKEGLPVVVFGGDHADVNLEETAGKVIARVLVDQRIPMVIDTSAFSKAGTRRFLHDFVTEVYHRNRQALHLVFDEADEVAPQRILDRDGGYSARLLGAMEDLVRRGRARGIGVTLVTQRPAVLNKDVLTQVEVLVAMGMTGVTDVKAIDEWIKLHDLDDQAGELRASLPSLPVGTGWVWSPSWLEILKRVSFRERRTFDSSATPKVGQVRVEPKVLASVDLDKLGAEIAATVEKQKAEDPKELRKRITELEQLHKELTRDLAERPYIHDVSEPVIEYVDRDVLSDDDRASIEALANQLEHVRRTALEKIALQITAPPERGGMKFPTKSTATVGRGVEHKVPIVAKPTPSNSVGQSEAELTGPERKILTALAPFVTRSHKQLAVLAGYKPSSSGFKNPLAHLRATGLASGGGEAITITDAGYAALGDYEPLPTGRALVDHWLSKLTGPEARILSALIDAYPNPLTAAELADRTGYSHTSSGFKNPLAKLRSHQLASGGGTGIVAAAELGEAGL